MSTLRAAITGHRPERLPDDAWVKAALRSAYEETHPSLVIQGMAAGADLWSAVVAWHLDIPFVGVKPWQGHRPRKDDEYMYSWVERHAQNIHCLSDKTAYPGAWVYHARNQYMVNHAEYLIAVWDGTQKGGTAATVRYAVERGIKIYQIDPMRQQMGWLHE